MGQGYLAQGRAMKILLLGSNNVSTSVAYKNFNLPSSILVNSALQEYSVGHTSRQEFSTDNELESVLMSADKVYWTHPAIEEFDTPDTYYVLLDWLKDYQFSHGNVVNFDSIAIDPFNWNVELPKFTVDDIVFFGSSTLQGVALTDPDTWYSTIVAKHFNKNAVNLARMFPTLGTNYKTVDLFSQCDFCEGQIVVVHVAPLWRLRYCSENNTLYDWQMSQGYNADPLLSRQLIEVYTKEFLFYQLLVNLRLIIKIARASKLRLVLLLDNYKDEQSISHEDQMYFYQFKEFIPGTKIANEMFEDYAEDNLHPGIFSNQLIAQRIIEHIEKVYK